MADNASLVSKSKEEVIASVKYKFESDVEQGTSPTSAKSPTWIDVWPQILSSVISLSTVIQAGINLAYSGVLIPQLANDPNIEEFTKHQASWIASLLVVSQPIGALFVGPFMDLIGRKKTCILTCLPTCIGWIIIYFTKSSLWPIYIARILAGLSSGMSTVGVVYTAEVSHAEFRAVLLALNSVNVAFGILIATVLGVYMDWHMSALVYGAFALISFLSSFYLPESPYWLANFTNTPSEEIKKSVKFLNRTKQLFDEEWNRIMNVIEAKSRNRENSSGNNSNLITKLKVFCERTSYIPLFILMALFFLQQTSGTYVVIFYTVNIFKSIVGENAVGFNEYNATTALGVLRFLMSIVSAILSKKVGRRPMLIISSVGMALSCVIIAIFFIINNISTINFESDHSFDNITIIKNSSLIKENDGNFIINMSPINNWYILISLLSFVCAGALGQMVIPWTLMGELLPTKIRAAGSGFLVSYAAVLLFAVIKSFPFIIDYITLPYLFISYSIMSIVSVIFVYFILPETFGKTFNEIAKHFEQKNNCKSTIN